MGIEYHLMVPESARASVAGAVAEQLVPLLRKLDPRADESFPHVHVEAIPEGLYVCDHLTDSTVASNVVRSLIDLLLRYSAEVSVVEP